MTHKHSSNISSILKPTTIGVFLLLGFSTPFSYVNGGGSSGGSSGGMGGCSSIGISNTQSLMFGSFGTASSGSITISTSGNRSSSGGIILIGSTYKEARFQVTGTANCTYSISLPSSSSISNGSQSMTINSYTKNPSNGTLNSSGNQTLYVGGKLNAGSSQQDGSYSGFFTVTVNYN